MASRTADGPSWVRMPTGSPGMDYGNEREAFDVVFVNPDRSRQIYASYPGN